MHYTEEWAGPVFCLLIRANSAVPLNACSTSINLCKHLEREMKRDLLAKLNSSTS